MMWIIRYACMPPSKNLCTRWRIRSVGDLTRARDPLTLPITRSRRKSKRSGEPKESLKSPMGSLSIVWKRAPVKSRKSAIG